MTDHADLLVELGCEELPPKTLHALASAFFENSCKGLADAGVPFDRQKSRLFYTPRRMAFRLAGVAASQADQVIDRKGPAVSAAFDADGKPTAAALGFARSVGREVEDLERQRSDKGEWLFCRIEKPGKALSDVLFPVLDKALSALPVAKPMRWSDHDFSFVRPVHWLLVIHGDDIVPGSLLGLAAGRETQGHRIHSPGPHALATAADYESVLKKAFVLADPAERQQRTKEQAEAAGLKAGGHTRITDALLEEVSNILEWPAAILCSFERSFLEVPPEALVASMEDHQKFFPVLDSGEGELTGYFVAMANLDSTNPGAVKEGFERVIRPRLADARFFWDQDRKTPLESRQAALDSVLFQKKLGSIGDKSKRLAALSTDFAEFIGADSVTVSRAALLCKCDLLTQMVGEFPELQGTMGAHYAAHDGEPSAVSTAIGEHYLPRYSGDRLPDSMAGSILAIADRLDSLLGVFAAGLKPTGNKDPFALRRAALGVARILVAGRFAISIDQLLHFTAQQLESKLPVSSECFDSARTFLLDRLRHFYSEQDVPTSVINAVFAAPVTTLTDLDSRIHSVAAFMARDEAEALVAANKRIGNILRTSEETVLEEIDSKLVKIEEERTLFDEVQKLERELKPLFDGARYDEALGLMASLKDTVESFFDQVMVMDENPAIRQNRLALLKRLKALFDRVADLAVAS
ncbi:MAG: glycine--tRNA ligase subunit beta [Gammaproteobacteria bacterium]|nr:glycine--tRNA ligase subunit beta [Gammaproteobacteria bacterium]